MNKQAIGEAMLTPQVLQHIAPDVVHPDGQKKLFEKAVSAHVAKKKLDAIMQAVSGSIGADSSSRVKDINTAAQKIGQKRLQGRDYKIEDIGDMLGGRITVDNEKKMSQAKQSMRKLSDAGIFDIKKEENIKRGTYQATHYDVILSNGTKAEVQLHFPQTELEALSNHTLRAEHGEKPTDKAIIALRDKQAAIAHSLPNDKAKVASQAMQSLMKQQNGKVSPIQSAQLLAAAAQR